MAVASIELSSDVMLVCLCHAMTTEAEEIMGLLLGDVVDMGREGLKTRIWSVSLHTREQAVRSGDRVEISPEQLAVAASEAERLSEELGLHTRVVGWYHSHPHLAVVPSSVDLHTQAMYQQLDSGFVGLIFSVFNHGSVVPGVATGSQTHYVNDDGCPFVVSMEGVEGTGRIQMTGFQSQYMASDGHIVPPPLPQSLSTLHGSKIEPTAAYADKVAAAAAIIANQPIQYLHKEVPIMVVGQGGILPCNPPNNPPKTIPCLSRLAVLMQTLHGEELAAFVKSVGGHDQLHTEGGNGHDTSELTNSILKPRPLSQAKCHPLVALHNSAVYQKCLSSMLEALHLPLITALEHKLSASQRRLDGIREEKERLKQLLASLSAAPPPLPAASPARAPMSPAATMPAAPPAQAEAAAVPAAAAAAEVEAAPTATLVVAEVDTAPPPSPAPATKNAPPTAAANLVDSDNTSGEATAAHASSATAADSEANGGEGIDDGEAPADGQSQPLGDD